LQRVLFDRPVLKIGALCARIGPPSEVELKTTYLDDRVRLGKGSRGSLFVFSRGGAADAAGEDLMKTGVLVYTKGEAQPDTAGEDQMQAGVPVS
jgi:hypothetical protein